MEGRKVDSTEVVTFRGAGQFRNSLQDSLEGRLLEVRSDKYGQKKKTSR